MNESAPKTVKEVDLLLKSQSLGTIGTQQPGHGHRNSKAEFGSAHNGALGYRWTQASLWRYHCRTEVQRCGRGSRCGRY